MSAVVGFVCCFIAALFFGSNFVPVKSINCGDGVAFQWVMCISIWCVGLILQMVKERTADQKFYAYAMIGGALWCTGNMCVVPVIKTIGLGIGMLVWGATCLLVGWAGGRFGWFGAIQNDPPSIIWLNYFGVAISVCSVFVYYFVKSNVSEAKRTTADDGSSDPYKRINDSEMIEDNNHSKSLEEEETFFSNLSPVVKKIFGFSLALLSGLFYGSNFNPVFHVMPICPTPIPPTCDPTDPCCDQFLVLDYVFSHFCGILATSTIYMIVYCIATRNTPFINNKCILPAFVSGIMWAVAQISYFIAIKLISAITAFPLVSTGPGVIASLWGVLYFKEVTGTRNFIILGCAIGLTILSDVCIVLAA